MSPGNGVPVMKQTNSRTGVASPLLLALQVAVAVSLCLGAVGFGAATAGDAAVVQPSSPATADAAAGTCTPVGGTPGGHAPADANEAGGAHAPSGADEGVTIRSPGAGERFARGDVIPIELALGEAVTGTLTVGGERQPITLDVTVRDTDGSGSATVYLNTFQIGNTTRTHGVFAPEEGTEIAAVDLQGSEAGDGPGGDGVIAAGSYDLAVAPGADPARATAGSAPDTATLELGERGSGEVQVWTAPGSAAVADAETAAAVKRAIDDGTLTPANGTVADGDLLVLGVPATGLAGALHEAALREPDVGNATALLAGDGDQGVTAPLFAGDRIHRGYEGSGVELFTSDMHWCRPWLFLDHANHSTVLMGSDSPGGTDHYYVVTALESGTELTTNDTERGLSGGEELTTAFGVRPIGDAGNTTAPPLPRANAFSDDQPHNIDAVYGSGAEVRTAEWTFVPATASVDWEMLTLENDSAVELAGTTTVAAGTTLTVTVDGEDDGFTLRRETTVADALGEENAWNVSLDLDGYRVGTAFEVTVTRAGSDELLTPDGAPIPGVLTAEPRVEAFAFEDQQIDLAKTSTVVVESFDAMQGGYVVVSDGTGEPAGRSEFQPPGAQGPVEVSLKPSFPTGDANLTAVAYRPGGDPYEADGQRVERTATVTFERSAPASFEVGDLQPQDATLAEPEAVEVTASVENTGGLQATKGVALYAAGDVVNETAVTLSPGESTTVALTMPAVELDRRDTRAYRVDSGDDWEGAAITVTGDQEPRIEVDAVDVGNVPADGPVAVAVTLRNAGGRAATGTVDLRFGGYARTLDSANVSLQADGTSTVTMTVPGEERMFNGYDTLNVSTGDDSETATLPPDDGSNGTTPETPTDADDGAGFGVVAAVLALLAGALATWRRRR